MKFIHHEGRIQSHKANTKENRIEKILHSYMNVNCWTNQTILSALAPLRKFMRLFTACTVVQAVVKATSQSNGKGQILTPGVPKPLNGFR